VRRRVVVCGSLMKGFCGGLRRLVIVSFLIFVLVLVAVGGDAVLSGGE